MDLDLSRVLQNKKSKEYKTSQKTLALTQNEFKNLFILTNTRLNEKYRKTIKNYLKNDDNN
jgi:hypothetical protein